LQLDRIDVSSVVRTAVDGAQVLPRAPTIKVSTPPRGVFVQADPGRLEQVFLNLLSNAIEHAPGSKTIEVEVKRSGRRAEISVRDFGPGVASEHLRTMFEAYTRLGQPHRGSGLGLGLYVAREIVTDHGGEIEATSIVGTGTLLTVRLPLAGRPTE
jgi:signal transduction histidine kinase